MSRMGLSRAFASKFDKHNPTVTKSSRTNPFDSDSDSERNPTIKISKESVEVVIDKSKPKSIPINYSENDEKSSSFSSHSGPSGGRNSNKNIFPDSGELGNQSLQDLENYAVHKAEETTEKFKDCVKIAEDIRENAAKTLITLNQQGEQIWKTHDVAANMDHELSRGEKLLGSLGGMFSKTWKPKKTKPIIGPMIRRDNSFKKKGSKLEQRERFGIETRFRGQTSRQNHSEESQETTSVLQKVEVEKSKQNDALSDLSNILDEMKDMALDMRSEIERQSTALDHFHDDADELNFRIKGANLRGRRLLGK